MPAATTTGADKAGNGNAKSREHNQGNQDRKYTIEQKAAVIRVRKCQATAFYDILGLEEVRKSCTEAEIKKAYRKLSLLTHPDKNGHEHADEAFKMVSRAFGVLSDQEKRTKYDRYGGDPDSRFGGGAPQQSPFSGFAQRTPSSRGGGGGSMWEEEISPEEMFNRFFGGGGMGGGFPFGDGPQFVFNLGGGPGMRVHQFGGGRPRRRPRDPNAPPEPPATLRSTIMGLLPLIILFILPLLSSLFSGSESVGPAMRFDHAAAPYTHGRATPRWKVNYYVNPADVEQYTPHKFSELDKQAEVNFVKQLNIGCAQEIDVKRRMIEEAQGWFMQDTDKLRKANGLEMKSCRRLDSIGMSRNAY